MSKRGYIYIYIYILVVICVLCGLGLAYSIGSVQRSATFSTITLDIERTLASNSAAKKADEFAGVDEFAAYARAQKFTHFTYAFTFVPSGKIFTHNRLYAMRAIALDPHIESITFARKGMGQFVAGSLLAPSVLQGLSEQGLIYTLSIQKKFYRAVAIGLLALCALFGVAFLWRHSRNGVLALAGNFGIVVLIFTLLIASARVYEESFKKYYPAHNAPYNLIALFTQAQAKGQDEITLTSKDIALYSLELQRLNTDPKGYPNEHISYFMRHYGYTKDIIAIRRVE